MLLKFPLLFAKYDNKICVHEVLGPLNGVFGV